MNAYASHNPSHASVDTVDLAADSAADAFVHSIHETGFAVLRNHPLPQTVLDRMDHDWRAFFAGDEKHAYRFDGGADDAQFGHFGLDVSERTVGHEQKDINVITLLPVAEIAGRDA